MLAKLNKPKTGFESLTLGFNQLEERLSETVLEQFVQHCRHLTKFEMAKCEELLHEQDRLNVLDFTTRILDEQSAPKLKEIYLTGLSSSEIDELTNEDQHLINALVRSGLT